MKKILMILAILAVALGFMLWKKATPEQTPLGTADGDPERPEAQSINLMLKAENRVSEAQTQEGFYGTNLSINESPAGDPAAMERRRAADLLYLESVVALDVRDGVNQEVREKERQMRQMSEIFWKGMPLRQITERLGGPSVIQTNITYSMVTTEDYAHGIRHQQYVQSIDFYYSPREGLKFIGRNGTGNQDLFLRLDTNVQLVSWKWQRPRAFLNGESGMWYKPR